MSNEKLPSALREAKRDARFVEWMDAQASHWKEYPMHAYAVQCWVAWEAALQAHATEAAQPKIGDFDPRDSFSVRTNTVTLQRNAAEAAQAQAQRIVAKPLEWEGSDIQEWFDKNGCGFYISHEDDGSDEPYSAAWGEGESETFATLEDAKEWCQGQIDSWVRENAMLAAAPQPQAAEPVATLQLPDPGAEFDEFGLWWDARDLEKLRKLPPGTKLYTHPQPAQDAKGCVWSEDEEGNWDTGCGNMFVINEGTPYDNEMGFCCYCGGKLDQVTQADAVLAKESGR